MNELSSLGLILLFALLAGHLVKFLRVPEVTGYIFAGIIVGPSVLGFISHDNLSALAIFSEVALGLILFSIGSVFEFNRFREAGAGVIRITLLESLFAAGLVTAGMLLLGLSWQVAFLLGAISMETAAASTLMVIRECNAEGPVSNTLLGVIGINNIFALAGFSLAAAAIDFNAALGSGGGELLLTVYQSVFPLVWQLVGSTALGFLIGLLLAMWAPHIEEQGEVLILMTGCVLLCVGIALMLDLSGMIASLAVGATMVNLSAQSRRMFNALSRTDPPFFAIFFVIAGADLNVALLKDIGVAGIVYVIARIVGKFMGARIAATRVGLHENVQKLLGFGLFSQAGLAIGLTIVVNRRFPEFASEVVTLVLAAVVVYELIGPVSAKLAINRSGESKPRNIETTLLPEMES